MIKKDDIFIVHVTDDLMMPALEYAEKSLHFTFNRMGKGNLYVRAQNIVKGVIMEGAFRKLLDHHKVKYDLEGATHWTKKDKYDVRISGNKYDVKGFFISNYDQRQEIKKDKSWFLDCSALVPADQLEARTLEVNDKYLFPFLTGWTMNNITDLYDMFAGTRERYLIHAFWDYEWFKNPEWKSLGEIIINTKMNEKFTLRLIGQDGAREAQVEKIALKPIGEVKTKKKFYTLLSIQTNNIPTGNLTVKSIRLKKTEKITLNDWGNILVYDGLVYFTGYMSKGEFKRQSKFIPRFYKKCKQYAETKTDNRAIEISKLHSLKDILPAKYDLFIP